MSTPCCCSKSMRKDDDGERVLRWVSLFLSLLELSPVWCNWYYDESPCHDEGSPNRWRDGSPPDWRHQSRSVHVYRFDPRVSLPTLVPRWSTPSEEVHRPRVPVCARNVENEEEDEVSFRLLVVAEYTWVRVVIYVPRYDATHYLYDRHETLDVVGNVF